MKYIVSVAVDGRVDVEVDAENFEEAREKGHVVMEATLVEFEDSTGEAEECPGEENDERDKETT